MYSIKKSFSVGSYNRKVKCAVFVLLLIFLSTSVSCIPACLKVLFPVQTAEAREISLFKKTEVTDESARDVVLQMLEDEKNGTSDEEAAGQSLWERYGFNSSMSDRELAERSLNLNIAYSEEAERPKGFDPYNETTWRINPRHLKQADDILYYFMCGVSFQIQDMYYTDHMDDYPSDDYDAMADEVFDPDGTVPETAKRQTAEGTEEFEQKLLVVTIKVNNLLDRQNYAPITPRLRYLVTDEDQITRYGDISSVALGDPGLNGHFRFYTSAGKILYTHTDKRDPAQTVVLKNRYELQPFEEIEIKMAFLVDLDYKDELYLEFNGTGGSYNYFSFNYWAVPLP